MQLLKFYSTTCQPCKTLANLLENIELIHDEYDEFCLDSNNNPAREFRIRALPTLIITDDNYGEIARATNIRTMQDLETFLQQHGIEYRVRSN